MIYGLTITNQIFEGEEIKSDIRFLRTIKTDKGKISLPYSHQLYKTAEERNISIFRNKKNHLSITKVAIQYNITIEEAQIAYDKAIEMFPEKFI